jgi:tetratricopeptide (TPR) repeat protein
MQENRPEETRYPAAMLPAATATAVPIPVVLSAVKTAAQSLKYEKAGDSMLERLNKVRDLSRAMDIAGNALDDYKKALDLDESNDRLMHKYCMAIEMKYYYMLPEGENEIERRQVFSDTLQRLERLHPGNNNTIYADYDITILLILNAQYFSIFQVIGAVNRIHDICEKVYRLDRSFENYSAAAALGRVHFLAPNIIFIMGWPDKNLSRHYLEESVRSNPDSLLIRFFLADTLYSLGKKDAAVKLFDSVTNTQARDSIDYFEDSKAKADCLKRMKELGLK